MQPQILSSSYLSKLNFAESNHLNRPVGKDYAIAEPYKLFLYKYVIYLLGFLGSQDVKHLFFVVSFRNIRDTASHFFF